MRKQEATIIGYRVTHVFARWYYRDHISPKINRAYIILGFIKRNIKEIESVQKEQPNL